MLVTMLAISMMVFFLAEVVPIDPARNALGPFATDEQVEALRHKWGLDQPALVRYGQWIFNALRGDFGESLLSHRPVSELVAARLERSLVLAALGFVFMMPIGLAVGFIAGIAEGSLLDRIISSISSIFVSIPSYARGIFLLVPLALWLGWLPGASIPDPDDSYIVALRKLILPILTLSIGEIGYLARFTRVSMAEVMHSDYIRTAVLKGIPGRKVIWRHALRNALIGPLTAVMLHVNWLVGGVLVAEVLFNYPGLGRLLWEAAKAKDVPLLEGGTLVLTFVSVATQVVADIGVFFLNPRIRFE